MTSLVLFVQPLDSGLWQVQREGGESHGTFVSHEHAAQYAHNWARSNMPSEIRTRNLHGVLKSIASY
jgi:hypothetical protein